VEPLAVAASAALNQEDGVEAEPPTTPLEGVVDVRLPEERQQRPADAEHVEELSVVELRSGQPTRTPPADLMVCERGTRSAEAARLLLDRGGSRYLGGGLQWRSAALPGQQADPAPAAATVTARKPTPESQG
jgi:rhodanese-related sulfurtransferase